MLEKGKSADRDKPGLMAEYSERLMELYEQQGKRDRRRAMMDEQKKAEF